jgi:hypothetical protein
MSANFLVMTAYDSLDAGPRHRWQMAVIGMLRQKARRSPNNALVMTAEQLAFL